MFLPHPLLLLLVVFGVERVVYGGVPFVEEVADDAHDRANLRKERVRVCAPLNFDRSSTLNPKRAVSQTR